MSTSTTPEPKPGRHAATVRPGRRGSWKLYLLLAICIAPVVASYLLYYVFPPSGRTNYGDLIEPQRPVPPIAARLIHQAEDRPAKAGNGRGSSGQAGNGEGGNAGSSNAGSSNAGSSNAASSNGTTPQGLAAFRGQWVLVAIDSGTCDLECAEKLFFIRQTHASLGKERDRVARVLLVTDDQPLPDKVMAAHPDLTVLQVAPDELARLFPVTSQTALPDHVYVIDPLQNLMMRFPRDPDPTRTRKDLQKLLRASRVG